MTTIMESEARQAWKIVEKQLSENKKIIQELVVKLKANSPAFVVTVARGSSDHAATFAKYLFETLLGLPTVSAAPSVLTLYGAELKVKNALIIGLSQSGKSPDICDVFNMAKNSGGLALAIVNNINSPMAKTADYVLPLLAEEERAVAATKSYIASLTALIMLVAYWLDDKKLLAALEKLPERLSQALELDWSNAISYFQNITDTLVIGRGYGFPIAQEAALKFKETCGIHAEAFSGAEVLHGPFALIKKNHPYLMFTQGDNSLEGMLNLAKKIKELQGKPIIAATRENVVNNYLNSISELILPLPKSLHPICDSVIIIQMFYLMVAKLAVARGFNPDAPDNLQKVTETR